MNDHRPYCLVAGHKILERKMINDVYVPRAVDCLNKFDVEILMVNENTEVFEGETGHDRLVIVDTAAGLACICGGVNDDFNNQIVNHIRVNNCMEPRTDHKKPASAGMVPSLTMSQVDALTVQTVMYEDDGIVQNNPILPLVIIRSAVSNGNSASDINARMVKKRLGWKLDVHSARLPPLPPQCPRSFDRGIRQCSYPTWRTARRQLLSAGWRRHRLAHRAWALPQIGKPRLRDLWRLPYRSGRQ